MITNPWGFEELMVLAAVNYCLGRQSYIVGVCAEWLIENWDNFQEHTRNLIKRDVEEACERDDSARRNNSSYKPLGMNCDRAEWDKVRALWKPEGWHYSTTLDSMKPYD